MLEVTDTFSSLLTAKLLSVNAGALVVTDIIISHLGNARESVLRFLHRLSDEPGIDFDYAVAHSERETGFHVSDTFEANTLSGLFMTRLERMPQMGDSITEGSYRLTVKAVKDHHVEAVLIEAITTAQDLEDKDTGSNGGKK